MFKDWRKTYYPKNKKGQALVLNLNRFEIGKLKINNKRPRFYNVKITKGKVSISFK